MARCSGLTKKNMATTPRDIAVNSAISALRTRRDRPISVSRLVGGGSQFHGFKRLWWNDLSPVLSQFNKHGSIQTHKTQLTLRVEDETRVAGPTSIASVTDIGPAQNLTVQRQKSIETPSVNRVCFAFVEPTCGVDTRTLAAISALHDVLDIIIDQHGIAVLTLTKNDFASGLYNTIKQWKMAPHLRKLKSRPFLRSMKPPSARRKKKPGYRHSQL